MVEKVHDAGIKFIEYKQMATQLLLYVDLFEKILKLLQCWQDTVKKYLR